MTPDEEFLAIETETGDGAAYSFESAEMHGRSDYRRGEGFDTS